MGEWQRNELSNATDIVYIIAMHENSDFNEPAPSDLERWQTQRNFEADALLLDPDRTVINQYIAGNPGPRYTQAVTVIIDKEMAIRRVGGTYDTNHETNLSLLIELSDDL